MIDYKSFQEVINILNASEASYLVLRNFDNLLEKEMYQDGHGDVDMLVADSKQIVDILKAQTYPTHGDDGTHYWIQIDGKKVSLDLRYVGDGYYCEKWEKDLLERKVLHNGFFIMEESDYFYTLIYHAILQKPTLSAEYKYRLTKMAEELHIYVPGEGSAEDFIIILEQYMCDHNYVYTYPTDIYVPLHKKYITKSMIQKNADLAKKHWKFDTKVAFLSFAVKCKHLLTTGKFK